MKYSLIRVVHNDKSVELLLNRPEALNALSIPMLKELVAALSEEIQKAKQDILVLKGEGRAFCAGADVEERKRGLSLETYLTERVLTLQEIASFLRNTEKVIIAALHGYVIGGGVVLSLFADFRIATEDTVFRFPEVDVGTTILCGGYKLLVEAVGLSKAKELLLLGHTINAAEAERIGLIHKLVKAKQLENTVITYVNELARKPSLTKRLIKRAAVAAAEHTFDQMLMMEIVDAIKNHKMIMEERER